VAERESERKRRGRVGARSMRWQRQRGNARWARMDNSVSSSGGFQQNVDAVYTDVSCATLIWHQTTNMFQEYVDTSHVCVALYI
jgi:hypothetical protein